LRKALQALQQQQEVTEDVRAAYGQLRQRAWAVGDVETSHAALDWMVGDIEGTFRGEARVVRLQDLGILILEDRDLAGGLSVLKGAVVHATSDLTPDQPVLAGVHHDLAVAQYRNGDIGGAEANWMRALEIREAAPVPDSVGMAGTLRNLAVLQREHRRNLSEARALLERSLALDRAALGPDDPQVARDLFELGLLQQAPSRISSGPSPSGKPPSVLSTPWWERCCTGSPSPCGSWIASRRPSSQRHVP
jgi:hypothetical protein